jgi:hypothetical protein
MIPVDRLYRKTISGVVAVLLGWAGPIPWYQPRAATAVNLEEQAVSVTNLKAVCLYKFFLFVNWPSLPEGTLTIGILGKDPFGKSFAEVENQLFKGLNKQLAIKRLGPYTQGTNLTQCQILFISASEQEHWGKIFRQIEGKPILTVGDQKGFLEAGGMMNFLLVQNKLRGGINIRWEINRVPLNQSGLRMNSQLLESAVRILPN